jgi:hypothetical protein
MATKRKSGARNVKRAVHKMKRGELRSGPVGQEGEKP